MADSTLNLGSSSTRRRIATLVGIIGVVVVASRLATVWPRKVDLAYEVGPGVTELDVDYLQNGEAVASARFGQLDRETSVFRHTVRLQPGDYRARFTLYRGSAPALETDRTLTVPADGIIRFDLRGAWSR